MAVGLAGLGDFAGGVAQGYAQRRQQEFAQRLQQAEFLGQKYHQQIEDWKTLPEGDTKNLAWQAAHETLDQQGKVMNDKGPGAFNTVKHFLGLLPGLGKVLPGQTDTPGGGKVSQSDVAMPSSAPGPSVQAPPTSELAGVPSGPLAATRAGQVPDVPLPYGGANPGVQPPRPTEAPPAESTVPGQAPGSTYSIPIQRVPQAAQQRTGTQPDYGQQPLTTNQRIGMNPPKGTDWGLISQAINESGGSIANMQTNPAAMKHFTDAMIDAYKAGNGPQATELVKTVMPDFGKQMMMATPESPAGQFFGFTKPTPIASELYLEATKANEPRTRLLNREATMTSQMLDYKARGQEPPAGMADEYRTMTNILHPPANRLEYLLRGVTDPQKISQILATNDQDRLDMISQIAEARAEANAAYHNPLQPVVRDFNGVAMQVHPDGHVTILKDPRSGEPMYTKANANAWFTPSKQHSGHFIFNEAALDRDYENDMFGTRAELQRIAASGQLAREIPAKDVFSKPEANEGYQGLQMWLAKKGIDPKEVGFGPQAPPSPPSGQRGRGPNPY